jgi:hypothetical protein
MLFGRCLIPGKLNLIAEVELAKLLGFYTASLISLECYPRAESVAVSGWCIEHRPDMCAQSKVRHVYVPIRFPLRLTEVGHEFT